jgi:hypothetical protein
VGGRTAPCGGAAERFVELFVALVTTLPSITLESPESLVVFRDSSGQLAARNTEPRRTGLG